jgi:hypothetical protein
MDPTFIPGRELSRQLYETGVRPLMDAHAPGIPYAAVLIGPGSDVLGYDTARSMDHDWGPRLTIILAKHDLSDLAPRLHAMFQNDLPSHIAGFPTRFREFADDLGIVHMATDGEEGLFSHRVMITSLPDILDRALGVRSLSDLDVATWLAAPGQTLLELTAGDVFRDDTGSLMQARAELRWYPDDLWRYRLAAAWKRISQIEPFIGRTGEVGDDSGSQVIALSLVNDIIRLALLQARRYAPYAKWLGTAFARLDESRDIVPHIDAARFARSWQEREHGIVQATILLAERQNGLALSKWVSATPRQFFDRPFTVIAAERFADALTHAITDPQVASLPPHLGGIDQFVDSTDALVNRELRLAFRDWLRTR